MAKMDKISWPLVALAAVSLAAVIVLAAMGQQLAAIGTVIASLLVILITQQSSSKETLGVVQTNTNGNNQKLIDSILRREESRDSRDSARDKLMYEMLLALPPGTRLPTLETMRDDPDGDVQGTF
jgi:hypothetical protein